MGVEGGKTLYLVALSKTLKKPRFKRFFVANFFEKILKKCLLFWNC